MSDALNGGHDRKKVTLTPFFPGMECFVGRAWFSRAAEPTLFSKVPIMMNRSYLLLYFFICVFSFRSSSNDGGDYFFKSPSVWNNQLDKTLISIQSSGYGFSIPRNYIYNGGLSNGYASFDIAAEFPDFSGINEQNFHSFSGSDKGDLKYTIRGPSEKTPNIIMIYKIDIFYDEERNKVFKVANSYGEKSKIDGLVRIPGEIRRKNLIGNGGGYLYVHASDSSDGVIIDCSDFNYSDDFDSFEAGVVENKNAVCRVAAKLENGLQYAYDFNFSLLKNWEEVDRGVRKLLVGFLRK